jgi:hypothetical protein
VRAPDPTRRRLSAALACIGAIAVLVGAPLTYAGHVLADTGQFSTRATSLLDNPSVRSIIASRVAEQATASLSVPATFEPVVSRAVDVAVGTSAFRRIFRAAIGDLHQSVFVNGSDTVTLRLANVGKILIDEVRSVSPALAALIPESVAHEVITISGGDFGQATRAARAIERAHTVGLLLLIAGGVAFLLAVALAEERRRALGYVGVAVLVDGVLLVVAYTVVRPVVLSRFAVGDDRTAAGAVWNAFLTGLRSDAVVLAVAGAVLAVVMWVVRPRGRRASVGR